MDKTWAVLKMPKMSSGQTGVQHVMVIASSLSNDAVQTLSIASSPLVKKSPLSPIWVPAAARSDTESLIDGHIVSLLCK